MVELGEKFESPHAEDMFVYYNPMAPYFGRVKMDLFLEAHVDFIKEFKFIGGLGFFDLDGELKIVLAKRENVANDFKTIQEIISDMETRVFFDELDNSITKEGNGHLEFDYFHLYLVKIHPLYVLTFFVIDEGEKMMETMQAIRDNTADIFDMDVEDDYSVSGQRSAKGQKGSETTKSGNRAPVPISSSQKSDSAPSPAISSSAPTPEQSSSLSGSSIPPASQRGADREKAKETKDLPLEKKPKKNLTKADLRNILKSKLDALDG